MYPSVTQNNEIENELIQHLTDKVVASKTKSIGACKLLTKKLVNDLDDSFMKHFGISFKDSFEKCFNVVPKKSSQEKRKDNNKIVRGVLSKINDDSNSTAVDRLYGSRQSLNKWDQDRKKKSFETVPICLKRTVEKQKKN